MINFYLSKVHLIVVRWQGSPCLILFEWIILMGQSFRGVFAHKLHFSGSSANHYWACFSYSLRKLRDLKPFTGSLPTVFCLCESNTNHTFADTRLCTYSILHMKLYGLLLVFLTQLRKRILILFIGFANFRYGANMSTFLFRCRWSASTSWCFCSSVYLIVTSPMVFSFKILEFVNIASFSPLLSFCLIFCLYLHDDANVLCFFSVAVTSMVRCFLFEHLFWFLVLCLCVMILKLYTLVRLLSTAKQYCVRCAFRVPFPAIRVILFE